MHVLPPEYMLNFGKLWFVFEGSLSYGAHAFVVSIFRRACKALVPGFQILLPVVVACSAQDLRAFLELIQRVQAGRNS